MTNESDNVYLPLAKTMLHTEMCKCEHIQCAHTLRTNLPADTLHIHKPTRKQTQAAHKGL